MPDFAYHPPGQATAFDTELAKPLNLPDRVASQGSSNSKKWYGRQKKPTVSPMPEEDGS